jgi:hypothetical protein
MTGIIITAGWLVVGVINLCSKDEISKLSYFLVWSVAMTGLFCHFFM